MDIDPEAVRNIVDPTDRARRAGDLIAQLGHLAGEFGTIRRNAIEELLAAGRTQVEIAADLGVTRSRIGQIIKAGPAPERAFFGTGPITVVVGGKIETGRRDPQPVIAQDDLLAYEHLSALLRALDVETQYEVTSPTGFVRLNRDNLIVLCGPRLSPNVREILESDPCISFVEDASGWHLVDRQSGETFRSPMDRGEPRDAAYFGRLPRPDGKGTFIYAAGIHAVGEAGVIHFLERELHDLYRELRLRRFSTIITCSFDPDSPQRQIVNSERAVPLYRHEG